LFILSVWSLWFIWLIWSIWLVLFHQIDETDQSDQTDPRETREPWLVPDARFLPYGHRATLVFETLPGDRIAPEAALAYALAGELGFTDDQVVWVRTGFDDAILSAEKNFDFNLQQYSITAERDEAVDFSDPYYTTAQALVAFPDSAVAGATTLADLKDATLGAQIGTTSLDFIEEVIQPTTAPPVFDTTVDAKSALEGGQIDGLVVDLPTAYYVTAVEIEGSVIVAQFATPSAAPDEYGLLFAEGNSLRDCVNVALAALRADGTLAALEDEWLVAAGGLVVISE